MGRGSVPSSSHWAMLGHHQTGRSLGENSEGKHSPAATRPQWSSTKKRGVLVCPRLGQSPIGRVDGEMASTRATPELQQEITELTVHKDIETLMWQGLGGGVLVFSTMQRTWRLSLCRVLGRGYIAIPLGCVSVGCLLSGRGNELGGPTGVVLKSQTSRT